MPIKVIKPLPRRGRKITKTVATITSKPVVRKRKTKSPVKPPSPSRTVYTVKPVNKVNLRINLENIPWHNKLRNVKALQETVRGRLQLRMEGRVNDHVKKVVVHGKRKPILSKKEKPENSLRVFARELR